MRKQIDFLKLQSMPEIEEIAEGEIDTISLEQEMMHHNGGLWLETLNYKEINRDLDFIARKYVPIFHQFNYFTIEQVGNKYPQMTEPCSMIINSANELSKHMEIGYQVAHFHYILGKKHYMDFPKNCCGTSSFNVMLSLMNFGYVNTIYAYNKHHDHAYILLPFVDADSGKAGSVLVDPTSDQLYKDGRNRNSVMIKLGFLWDYRTDWADGANLFPDRLYSIETIKKSVDCVFVGHEFPDYARNGIEVLNRAFSNPVNVNISMTDTQNIEQKMNITRINGNECKEEHLGMHVFRPKVE